MRRVLSIDPPDCGCTECILGDYIAVNHADERHIVDMLRGRTQNNSGCDFTVAVEYELEDGYNFNIGKPESAKARWSDGDSGASKEWDITSWWAEVAAEQHS